jgi:hypothetical protein
LQACLRIPSGLRPQCGFAGGIAAPSFHKRSPRAARSLFDGTKSVETHGYCTYTDNDNDLIFEKCDFLPGRPNTCELTGGTGKFQGLQASIVITTTPVKSTYEGAFQSVGHKNGTYKIVKTN